MPPGATPRLVASLGQPKREPSAVHHTSNQENGEPKLSTRTTTGASRRPLYIDAMSKRRARPVTSASTAVISAKRPVAVVTGAGRGIGRLLALRLSDAGYAVALVARSQQELRETARLIDISGGRTLCLPADVTDEARAPEVIRRVEAELGPIELLVNNAGILGPTGPTWEVDLQAWWRTVDTNLFGTLVYTRQARLPASLALLSERMTRDDVDAPPGKKRTPRSSSPSVMPVAAKNASPATRSFASSTRVTSWPASSALRISS